jgi:hypothetical protein
MVGDIDWQGPHHGAVKCKRMASFDAETASSATHKVIEPIFPSLEKGVTAQAVLSIAHA